MHLSLANQGLLVALLAAPRRGKQFQAYF